MRSQGTFKASASSLTKCSKPTTKDQILNAEIFADSKHGGQKSWWQWQVKKDATGLANCWEIFQEETKSKYIVQFGLALFV